MYRDSGPINRTPSLPREARRFYLVPVLTAFMWENQEPVVSIRIFHGLLSDALKLRGYNHIPVSFTYWLEWWLRIMNIHSLLFQRSGVSFPVPKSGSSQMPVTPAPRDPRPTSVHTQKNKDKYF